MKKHQNEPLKKHSTFKIGGRAKSFLIPESTEELKETIIKNKKHIVLGMGSNILFPDNLLTTPVISTSRIDHCIIDKTKVIVGSGFPLGKLVKITANKGLSGLEFLAGIPGSVGGAVIGNAGAWRNSIDKHVEFVKVFTNSGQSKTLNSKKIKFSYRKSGISGVIYEVGLKLKKKRKSSIKKSITKYLKLRSNKHPNEPSAGSIFINPIVSGKNKYTAGELIEMAGLKGLTIGGAKISKKHANFIINNGKASANDVKKLVKTVQNKVKKQYKIALKPEIKIIE